MDIVAYILVSAGVKLRNKKFRYGISSNGTVYKEWNFPTRDIVVCYTQKVYK
jgi:hypothetical protein